MWLRATGVSWRGSARRARESQAWRRHTKYSSRAFWHIAIAPGCRRRCATEMAWNRIGCRTRVDVLAIVGSSVSYPRIKYTSHTAATYTTAMAPVSHATRKRFVRTCWVNPTKKNAFISTMASTDTT